jgi:Predicted endonuclease containing a URI domain
MGNKADTVFYTGVTNDLLKRATNHKEKINEGFTKRYRISKLLYYEVCETIEGAILREKQIKAGSRQKKIDLITNMNSVWVDLYEELTK